MKFQKPNLRIWRYNFTDIDFLIYFGQSELKRWVEKERKIHKLGVGKRNNGFGICGSGLGCLIYLTEKGTLSRIDSTDGLLWALDHAYQTNRVWKP